MAGVVLRRQVRAGSVVPREAACGLNECGMGLEKRREWLKAFFESGDYGKI